MASISKKVCPCDGPDGGRRGRGGGEGGLVCQRNENGEVSWEKWKEKDNNCCVPRHLTSETKGTTESASVLIYFFEAEAHQCLTLFGLRAIFLEADGVLDGVLS